MFAQGFQSSHFIRIGDNNQLNLYIGKDDHGSYCFEFRGKHYPIKVLGSDVISVKQFKNDNDVCLRFSLEEPDLLELFSTFCQDLLDSTIDFCDDNNAYKAIINRYGSWKKLFKSSFKKLSETDVMGLLGELLFLQDYLIPLWGEDKSLEGWTRPEKTHKDFSIEDEWYEVKSISSGKDTITISSIEQLDSDADGTLVVYQLEKMSPSYNGLKLAKVVMSIFGKLNTVIQKELFLSKLELFGFDFSVEYDNYVYSLTNYSTYSVSNNFPRLKRNGIPNSISKAQYEIILSEIEQFKNN